MRRAAVALAALLGMLFPGVAAAEPTEVLMRIEGRTETLFEGPLLTEGHNVRAADSDPGAPADGRPCDGSNNGGSRLPSATPTAAAVDAMAILGQTFDGRWYSGYDDYFITRWGPDAQDETRSAWWGILVNNVYIPVGGCQQRLAEGDEVLWAYDAFDQRPRLALYPGDYGGGPLRLTAEAPLRQPFELDAVEWGGYEEMAPPATPARSPVVAAGAEIVAEIASPKGFEEAEAGPPLAVTGPDGSATLTFQIPGWYRVKAVERGPAGEESAIRSNRVDICVPPPLTTGCGRPPADDVARVPPLPSFGESATEEEDEDPGTPPGVTVTKPAATATAPPAALLQANVRFPQLDRSHLAQGYLLVRWKVLDPGVGIAGWQIAARRLGRRGSTFVTVAGGTSGSRAKLRLPRGASYRLRFTVTDRLDRSASVMLGRVKVPRLPRSRDRGGRHPHIADLAGPESVRDAA
ncbi:MAG TPA: DUF4430 domain-containing protein [Solirubrobacterales bacterium]|nr:DUF4430 domain-containing protein [Solirubrobacterales bacterium]